MVLNVKKTQYKIEDEILNFQTKKTIIFVLSDWIFLVPAKNNKNNLTRGLLIVQRSKIGFSLKKLTLAMFHMTRLKVSV